MVISEQTWQNYIERLRKVNDQAAKEMFEYLATHEWFRSKQAQQAAVDFAFALATKYGEAAAAAACEMYDAIAMASMGHMIRPAMPADTATYGETAKSMYGTMKKTRNIEYIADSVGRLVKLAGVDTMMMNAMRDGAEWAWIPSGDSCAFCMMLSSRGWQRASQKAIRNGHARHVHANCDCTYAVRFDPYTNVEGYDPEEYLDKYNATGETKWQDKLKALRREHYAEHKDEINAQKRAAYALRTGDSSKPWKY